jgi:hypothetical protein
MADEDGLEEVTQATAGGGGFPTWAIWLIVGAVVIIAIVVVVVVLFVVDSGPPNQAPTISSVAAADSTVSTGEDTTISLTATDPDGDTLTYSWTATDGDITGTGSSVVWTPPSTPGTYIITVTVSDGKGGSHTSSTSVTVEPVVVNKNPVITSVTPGSATVPPGGSTTVTCTATDPDGDPLTYSWQASLGTISGTGNSVTWDAPMTEGVYSIQCDVEDGRGGNAHRNTNVEVAEIVTAGSIKTESTPSGASVYFDGVDTGSVTPYTINNVPAGPHTVKLRRTNYKDRQEVVVVTADVEATINWALTYTASVIVVLQPDGTDGKDTYIYEGAPTNNEGSNVGIYASGALPNSMCRLFIEFDLSTIPSTSIVTDAKLGLRYYDDYGTATAGPIGAYRITQSWDEGTLTWDTQPNSVSAYAATTDIPEYGMGPPSWRYWDIDALAHGWVSGSIPNYGVLLRDTDESTEEGWKGFRSSDYVITPADRPKLTITYYDPVP